jgi:invasion protein IalB
MGALVDTYRCWAYKFRPIILHMRNKQVCEIITQLAFCSALLLCWPAIAHAQTPESAGAESGGQLFGDWVVHCDNEQEVGVNCKMSQMAIVEETQERLLRINIRYVPVTEDAAIQFVLPLGVSLKFSPRLLLDGRLVKNLDLDLCLTDGCYSTFPLDAELLENFLAMKKGTLEVKSGNGSALQLPISGTGSRTAYRAMRTLAMELSKRR